MRAAIDIKDQLRGRETEILHALGIGWPVRGAKHIHCPFPNHDDKNPSWRWDSSSAKFYCTCSQGSIIDAVLGMHGGTFAEAADWCRKKLGIEQAGSRSNICAQSFLHSKLGLPSAWWLYQNARGQIVGAAARYVTRNGKDVIPWVPDGPNWQSRAMPAPRPLYCLPELLQRKYDPVLIVEGEKTVDAAARLFPDHAVTTNAGGCKAWRQSDWSPLIGRNVVIWPDNDDPGIAFARHVAEHLLKEGVRSAAIVQLDEQWPDKWDLADPLPPVFYPEDLHEMVADAMPVELSRGRPQRKAVQELKASCDDPRPLIQIEAGQLASMASQAEEYLLAAKVEFYQRGDTLVRPIIDKVPTPEGRIRRTPRLKSVNDIYMLLALSEHIRFERFDKRVNDWVTSNPPKELAAAINARSGKWRFPVVSGVIGTPTLRADGSLLDKPGYDPATGLLLMNPPELPEMPDEPTRDDALDALVLLKELLAEFPFVDDVSLSVALSALITPVLRGGLGAAPMHVTTAPQAGTGKSYLFDVAATIAIGDLCPVMGAGKTEDELDKRIGAELMTGQPIISIDNVNGDLGGVALCQAIERPIVSVRVLGRSENQRVENRTCFFSTGNNIRLVADLTRRALLCSLDCSEERPELRPFTAKPAEIVLNERGHYIAACLNVVRAYNQAGRPECLPVLASFENWSKTVRSALVWLGEADPAASIETACEIDPQREEISAFLHAFAAEIGEGPGFKRTAAQIIKAAQAKQIYFGEGGGMRELNEPAHPLLKEAIENISPNGKPNSKSLGKWLSGHMNAVHTRRKLRRWNDEKKGHKWFIECV